MAKTAMNRAHRRVLDSVRKAVSAVGPRLGNEVAVAGTFLGSLSGKIVTTGIGKSGFIAQKIAATLTSLGVPAVFLHPTEALHGDLGIVGPDDAVLAFSHSGNTKELIGTLHHLYSGKTPIVSVCSDRKSRLAAMSRFALIYPFTDEGSPHGLAPMASTTLSLLVGDMLAAETAAARGFTKERFAQLHPAGSLGLQLTTVGETMYRAGAVPLVRHDALFRDAVRLINAKRLGVVGVVDGRSRLVGVLTDGDIRRFVLSDGFSLLAPVTAIMTLKPITVGEKASLLDALRTMEQRKITSLFVTDIRRRPEGLIHMHQIVERQLG